MGETQFANFIREVIAEEIDILRYSQDVKRRKIAHKVLKAISHLIQIQITL